MMMPDITARQAARDLVDSYKLAGVSMHDITAILMWSIAIVIKDADTPQPVLDKIRKTFEASSR